MHLQFFCWEFTCELILCAELEVGVSGVLYLTVTPEHMKGGVKGHGQPRHHVKSISH